MNIAQTSNFVSLLNLQPNNLGTGVNYSGLISWAFNSTIQSSNMSFNLYANVDGYFGPVGQISHNSTTLANWIIIGTLNTTTSTGRCGSLVAYIYGPLIQAKNITTSVSILVNSTV